VINLYFPRGYKILSPAFLTLLFLCGFLTHLGHPETIILKNGTEIEGTIVEENDNMFTIDFSGVQLKFNKEELQEIKTNEIPEPEEVVDTTEDEEIIVYAEKINTKTIPSNGLNFKEVETTIKLSELSTKAKSLKSKSYEAALRDKFNNASLPAETKAELTNLLSGAVEATVGSSKRHGSGHDSEEGGGFTRSEHSEPPKEKTLSPNYYKFIVATAGNIVDEYNNYHSQRGSFPDLVEAPAGQALPLMGKDFYKNLEHKKGYEPFRFSYRVVDNDHFQLYMIPRDHRLEAIYIDESGIFRLDSEYGTIIKTDE
jgi:hypothetical protein